MDDQQSSKLIDSQILAASQAPASIAAPTATPPAALVAPVAAPVQITQPVQIGQNLAETVQPVELYDPEAKKARLTEEIFNQEQFKNPNVPEEYLRAVAGQKAIQAMAQDVQAIEARAKAEADEAARLQNVQRQKIDAENKLRAQAGLPQLPNPANERPVEQAPPELTSADIGGLPGVVKDALTQPDEAQIKAQIDAYMAPARAANAEKFALDRIAKEEQFLQKVQAEREAKLAKDIEAIDNRVRQKSFAEVMQTGSLGQKIGAAFGALLGAVGQGLTGAKSNPVLDYMDKVTEQQAAKDKLSQDEKEALRAQVYRQGQEELKKLDSKSLNAYRRDQLAQEAQKLAQAESEIRARLTTSVQAAQPSDIYSGRPLKGQEVLYAKQHLPDRVATLPNGKSYVLSKDNATNLKTAVGGNFDALKTVEKLRELGRKGDKMSLTDKDTANILVQDLVGKMRLPFLGPGTMQQQEYDRLISMIGDPLSWRSWTSREDNKLRELERTLKAGAQTAADMHGVVDDIFGDSNKKFKVNLGGQSRLLDETQLNQLIANKYPNMSENQRQSVLQKLIGQ